MQENTQQAIPRKKDTSGVLDIHSVFETIQGEGPFCGERALFFRLWGCNLMCPGCDTDYTSKRSAVAPDFMRAEAKTRNWQPGAVVVISGGEPLRQNIVPAVNMLLEAGYYVQIETNGVLWLEGLQVEHERFFIICSPKTSAIHPMILEHAAAFKYVVRADEIDPDDGLPMRALMHKAAPRVARPPVDSLVYIQPMDEQDEAKNARNLQAAIQGTMRHGYRLQLQIHKLLEME